MAVSKFNDAKLQITAVLNGHDKDILKQVDISNLLDQHRETWNLSRSMTEPMFARRLVDAKVLREHIFPFPMRKEKRFAKVKIPMLEVLQSVKINSYFTHAFAMQAHQLSDSEIFDIYLNFEQAAHARNGLPEQKSIDTAFRSKPRNTQNIIKHENYNIVMLNGMYTGLLGVETRQVKLVHLESATVRITDLERTLIDITVRPHYAGTIEDVLCAFISARDRIDIEKLAAYLTALNYVYPYHQALGWYLSRAGFSDAQLSSLRVRPRERYFYLAHQMKDFILDEHWKIFVPTNFSDLGK